MKIEKHNSHGLQLSVTLTPAEALTMARKLLETAQRALEVKSPVNYYVTVPCLFEDDNERWEPTDFTVSVGSGNPIEWRPTYPCGKEIVQGGMNSAPEFCNEQEGHEHGCYRR
jgi:hypothetical protein